LRDATGECATRKHCARNERCGESREVNSGERGAAVMRNGRRGIEMAEAVMRVHMCQRDGRENSVRRTAADRSEARGGEEPGMALYEASQVYARSDVETINMVYSVRASRVRESARAAQRAQASATHASPRKWWMCAAGQAVVVIAVGGVARKKAERNR